MIKTIKKYKYKFKGFKMESRKEYCPLCEHWTQLCRVGFMRWNILRCSECLIKYMGKDWHKLFSKRKLIPIGDLPEYNKITLIFGVDRKVAK